MKIAVFWGEFGDVWRPGARGAGVNLDIGQAELDIGQAELEGGKGVSRTPKLEELDGVNQV